MLPDLFAFITLYITVSAVDVMDPIRCPDLEDPTNGAVLIEGEGEGALATYTCISGFQLSGEGTLECTADGEWVPSPPTCESKSEWAFFILIETMAKAWWLQVLGAV